MAEPKTKEPARRARKPTPRRPRDGREGGGALFATSYTPELGQAIADRVAKGNYLEVSAAAAGVARRTFYDWLRRGRDGEEPYADLVRRLEVAEARAEETLLEGVAATGENDWTSYMTRLERRFPTRWGRRNRVDLGNPDGEAFRLDVGPEELDAMPVEGLREVKELLARLREATLAGGVPEVVEDAQFREIGPGEEAA